MSSNTSSGGNGLASFITTDVFIAVIATSLLGIAIVILTTVLVGACVYYYRKKNMRRIIQSQTSALPLTIPSAEASKLFVVESYQENNSSYNGTQKESKHLAIQFPTLLLSSLKRKTNNNNIQQEPLQIISKPIVLEMESNPNYHQLATNQDGADTPESSSSPILIVTSEPANPSQSLPTTANNSSSLLSSTSHNSSNVEDIYTTPSVIGSCLKDEQDGANSGLKCPDPPNRHQSLINSYSKSLPPSEYQKFIPRAQSDNQIGMEKDYSDDLYGPIYSELSNRLSTSVVKIKVISKSNIRLIRDLGMGQFGLVYLGETVGLSQRDLEIGDSINCSETFKVAVKMLRPNPPHSEKLAFEREVKYMSHFKHKNVVQLLAVCWKDEQFILMEYMRNGDLQNFLQQYDSVGSITKGNKVMSQSKLLRMATQIADAMMYLASCKFIHRDLATRNCLVGDNSVVKVADFGLSRNLYDSCYYRFQGSAMLPVRWMANECFYGRFSEKTDVWAFGVTMWEIFSLCKEKPYSTKTDQQLVLETLHNSRTMLEKPKFCHENVYNVMRQCMKEEAKDRLNFEQVFNKLSHLTVS